MACNKLNTIADILIDFEYVKNARKRQMKTVLTTYKDINIFLGYCSQMDIYSAEFESMMSKLMLYRKEIILRYGDLLLETNIKMYKSLLIPPNKTHWFAIGIRKYKEILKYCIHYYRIAIQSALISGNEANICAVIDTIIIIDKYYKVYKKIIDCLAKHNQLLSSILQKKYMSYIQL